jgi:hypothetical protein
VFAWKERNKKLFRKLPFSAVKDRDCERKETTTRPRPFAPLSLQGLNAQCLLYATHIQQWLVFIFFFELQPRIQSQAPAPSSSLLFPWFKIIKIGRQFSLHHKNTFSNIFFTRSGHKTCFHLPRYKKNELYLSIRVLCHMQLRLVAALWDKVALCCSHIIDDVIREGDHSIPPWHLLMVAALLT